MSFWDNISYENVTKKVSSIGAVNRPVDETGGFFSGLSGGLNSLITAANTFAGSDLGKIGTELLLRNNLPERRSGVDSSTSYVRAERNNVLDHSPNILSPAGTKAPGQVLSESIIPIVSGVVILFFILKMVK